jgi:hypothetical protein
MAPSKGIKEISHIQYMKLESLKNLNIKKNFKKMTQKIKIASHKLECTVYSYVQLISTSVQSAEAKEVRRWSVSCIIMQGSCSVSFQLKE